MISPAKLEKTESVQRVYPSLRLCTGFKDASLILEGNLQPIRFIDELDAILNDLEHDRAVFIVPGEYHEIRHHPECKIEHEEHRLTNEIRTPFQSFTVIVEDFGDGRLPKSRLLDPPVKAETRYHTRGLDGICSFAPWQYPWDKNNSSLVEFIDHSLIWLLKWNVYTNTGIWLGTETPHDDPKFFLATIRPSDPCRCFSGRPYETCCFHVDAYLSYGESWRRYYFWSKRHDSNLARFEQVWLPRKEAPICASANA